MTFMKKYSKNLKIFQKNKKRTKKVKLGFFGGSFNPPTIAHYNLIKQALKEYNFDKVYFVPVNDYYKKEKKIVPVSKAVREGNLYTLGEEVN